MFKKFAVYVDDGNDVLKIIVPAKNAKDAERYVEGSGEIIRVKELEDFYIDEYKVRAALNEYGFGLPEQDLICRTLARTGII